MKLCIIQEFQRSSSQLFSSIFPLRPRQSWGLRTVWVVPVDSAQSQELLECEEIMIMGRGGVCGFRRLSGRCLEKGEGQHI